jgi:transposase, IS30 family
LEPRRRRRLLTNEQAGEIRRLAAQGVLEREIVRRVGVSKGSIWRTLYAPRRAAPEWQPRRGCLGLEQRVEIVLGVRSGLTFTVIAARLGVAVSTVSREVGGRSGCGRYDAVQAQRRARRNARRPKVAKLERNRRLGERVAADLRQWWSPQQIAATLHGEFPADPEMWVSHETIYKSLFVQGRGALRKEIAACLRSGRAVRRSRNGNGRGLSSLRNAIPISERPAEAEDRAVPGHWEGDLIFGRGHKHAIGTLVERRTRFVLLFKPDGTNAEAVREAMTATVQTLPSELLKTLAWDRGAEMAGHQQFTVDTGLQVYFCDPHSPWQRGSNENTNGLLRQYFPKASDFSLLTQEQLDRAAASLNNRPRQTLNWLKPAQALAELLALTG